MGLFGNKRKKATKENFSLDNIEFECLSKAHMPPITISENPEAVQICLTCENPMFPEVLANAILAGRFEGRELNQTELANCVTILPYLFWAQHNLQIKPFIIQGDATGDVKASINIPISTSSQEDILETLDALDSFGTQEMGDASDLKTLLVLGRHFLQWSTSDISSSGSKQVSIEPLPHFAVLNSKNFEPLRKLSSQVSKQLGWATWDHYVDFFSTPLAEVLQHNLAREVLEVRFDFQVTSTTQSGGLIVATNVAELELLRANVLPVLGSDRKPTNLIGPVNLEIQTKADAFKADIPGAHSQEQSYFELEFKTTIKFLVLMEQGAADTESKLLSLLDENFQLAIYYDDQSQKITWHYLNQALSPVTKSTPLDLQIISLGAETINVAVKRLSLEEAAKNLEGTPWRI